MRRSLRQAHELLTGLYVGQPKRATARPTTELLLRAFKGLALVIVHTGATQARYLTAFTPVQERILQLLKFPTTRYTRLVGNSTELVPKMGES